MNNLTFDHDYLYQIAKFAKFSIAPKVSKKGELLWYRKKMVQIFDSISDSYTELWIIITSSP